MLLAAVVPALGGDDARRSGFDDMAPATQAMQRDDAQNPAALWVAEGEQRWKHGCAACHGDASKTLRGAAARHPAFDARIGAPVNLAQRIRTCQARSGQPVAAFDSDELLALEAYVARQSRGMPIDPPNDGRLAAGRALGERLFRHRMGQLDLACAQCHDRHADGRLAGNPITQGHPTGYPIYRLEWQGMGSLQRRLRNCMSGIRAEPYAFGASELVALELYLAQRAAGMTVESPAVRP